MSEYLVACKVIYAATSATHANDCSPSDFHIVELSLMLTVQLFGNYS